MRTYIYPCAIKRIADDLPAAEPRADDVDRPVQLRRGLLAALDQLLDRDMQPARDAREDAYGGVDQPALNLAQHALADAGERRSPVDAQLLRLADPVDVLPHRLIDLHCRFPPIFCVFST